MLTVYQQLRLEELLDQDPQFLSDEEIRELEMLYELDSETQELNRYK